MDSLSGKEWRIATEPDSSVLQNLVSEGIHPVLSQILVQRGYTSFEDALAFLEPLEYAEDDNPFRMKGMVDAVYRVRLAIRRHEKIVVYGDFDCDGVTSSALMITVLRNLKADVDVYIPDRVDEGYGLNSNAIKSLADQGYSLVITVDCGIRAIEEVEDANRLGLDVIITDHHSVGDLLPNALAIVNPQQEDCDYPEKRLSGVGVVYKFAQALYMEARRRGYNGTQDWHPDDFLDLVALGTVADVMSLAGENRLLLRRGLVRLNAPKRIGLLALYEAAGVRVGSVTATTIGFILGPRINAAGRLKSARIAFDLLMSEDPEQARLLASELNEINRIRQELTAAMQSEAESMVKDISGASLIFSSSPTFEQGVVGLVAGRLTEQHYRPSAVLHVGEDESHGSCRSIPEFHITRALEQCSDLLTRFGGHAMAAGFTVGNHNLEQLQDCLERIAHEQLDGQNLKAKILVDAEIHLSDIGHDLMSALASLEPTGEGNPSPVFLSRNIQVLERITMGAEQRHLKLMLGDQGYQVEAVAFGWGERISDIPALIDIVYQLGYNEWNGRKTIQILIRDIRGVEI